MNEMRSLYEEFSRLKNEVTRLNKGDEFSLNLDEVGAFRLREFRRRFEDLHRRNLILQSSSRTRNIDNEELRQVLNLGDRMWDELGLLLNPIVQLIDLKMTLGFQVARERRNLQALKEENLKTIRSLTNQYNRFRKTVEAITDQGIKSILEEKLRVDAETIQRLRELDNSYGLRINELAEKLRVIALGGKLPELAELRNNTAGLTPEEAIILSNRMREETEEPAVEMNTAPILSGPTPTVSETPTESVVPTSREEGIPEVEFTSVDPVTRMNPIGDEPTEEVVPPLTGGSEPTEEPVPPLTGGSEPTEEPVPPLTGGDGSEEDEEEEEEPVPPLTGTDEPTEEPIPPLTGGDGSEEDEEEEEEPVPPFPGSDDHDEEEEDVPGLDDDEDEEELDDDDDVETEEDEEEEEPPVRATVKAPKSSLWQRIHKVLEGVKVFLLTAIAVHTGLIIKDNNTQRVQPNVEPEVTEQTEAEVPTETPAETVTPTETPTEAPTEAPAETETPAQTPVETETPAQSPAETSTETPTETPQEPQNTVDNGSVVLSPGESVYDSSTGVEVGYTGVAAHDTQTGTESQQQRDLEHPSSTTAVVTNDDLKPDSQTQTGLPRTGEEISEEEARKKMTAEEEENLDDAIDEVDWEAFFNDGPVR